MLKLSKKNKLDDWYVSFHWDVMAYILPRYLAQRRAVPQDHLPSIVAVPPPACAALLQWRLPSTFAEFPPPSSFLTLRDGSTRATLQSSNEKCTSDHFWTCAQGSNIWLGSSSGINPTANGQTSELFPTIGLQPQSNPDHKSKPGHNVAIHLGSVACFKKTYLIKSLITGSWSSSPTCFHIIRPFHKPTPTDPPNYQVPSLI